MSVVFAILGLILGIGTRSLIGAVAGTLLGWLFGEVLQLRSRLGRLEGSRAQDPQQILPVGQSPTPAPADKHREPKPPPASALQAAASAATGTASEGAWTQPASEHPQSSDLSPDGHPSGTESIAGLPQVAARPALLQRGLQWVVNYFTQDNAVVRIGAIVLFFGLAFLAKYAAEHTQISVAWRMLAIGTVGVGLALFGWRIRRRQKVMAEIFQGLGVAVLFLTVFASYRLYHLLGTDLTFILLVGLSLAGLWLAITQDSQALALLFIAGGFAAPVLASSGAGHHVVLFSYYLLLNLALFAAAWYKTWRWLNLTGFVFTFLVSIAWGVTRYHSQDFVSTEPFLIAYFMIFSLTAVLYAWRQPAGIKAIVDGTLVFGTPLIAFPLQARILPVSEYGLAWSALAVAVYYAGLCGFLYKKLAAAQRERLQVLLQSLAILGVIFASMSIALAFDARWTAASWAIEGAGLLWLGARQTRRWLVIMAPLLQLGAALAWAFGSHYVGNAWLFLNADYLGIAVLAVAGLLSARVVSSHWPWRRYAGLAWVYLLWGMGWWYLGSFHEIGTRQPWHISTTITTDLMLLFAALSGALWQLLGERLRWRQLDQMPWVTLVSATLILSHTLARSSLVIHPLSSSGVFAWLVLFSVFYGVLWRQSQLASFVFKTAAGTQRRAPRWLPALHFIAVVLLSWLLTHDLRWQVIHLHLPLQSWGLMMWALPIVVLFEFGYQSRGWPMAEHTGVFRQGLPMAASIYLVGWSLLFNFPSAAATFSLPYWPFLNPLDIVQFASMAVMWRWWQRYGNAAFKRIFVVTLSPRVGLMAFAGWIFLALNVTLLRTLHHTWGIAYRVEPMMHSDLVQTSLSVFWAITGVSLMFWSNWKQRRTAWVPGVVLLGVVTVKLFLVDLSGSGTIERIVSFLVVGALLLVVGYLAPIPPPSKALAAEHDVEPPPQGGTEAEPS